MQAVIDNAPMFCDVPVSVGTKGLTRRVSLDNLTQLVDNNGNKNCFRRMNSYDSSEAGLGGPCNIFELGSTVDISRWESSFMSQIQDLIKKVKVTDTNSNSPDSETLQDENENTPVLNRRRRKKGSGKGCDNARLSNSYKCATRTGRVIRRSNSRNGYAGGSYKCAIRHGVRTSFSKADAKGVVARNGRGKQNNRESKSPAVSVRRSTSFLKAVQQNPSPACGGSPAPSRRRLNYSAVAPQRSRSISRRNSFASSAGSRSSSLSRRPSVNAADTLTSQCGCLRRNDSFTVSCFQLTLKSTDVKKRAKKLSRKKRRKERAHIDVLDVQHAVSVMNNNDSGSIIADDIHYQNFDDENIDTLGPVMFDGGSRFYNINRLSRITEVSVDSNRLSRCLTDFDDENEINEALQNIKTIAVTPTRDDGDAENIHDSNGNEVHPTNTLSAEAGLQEPADDNSDETVEENAKRDSEIKSSLRRRASIQIRSWELSRRLRQRRRERRKGFNESALI